MPSVTAARRLDLIGAYVDQSIRSPTDPLGLTTTATSSPSQKWFKCATPREDIVWEGEIFNLAPHSIQPNDYLKVQPTIF